MNTDHEYHHDDEMHLIDGEVEVSDRDFIAEFLGDIFSGDHGDGFYETPTAADVSDANESRHDEVLDEIFNPETPLTHSFWVNDDISAKIFQSSDDDNRILTDVDAEKAEEILRKLETELFGLPAVEERKRLLRVVKKVESIIQEHRYQYAKLDDISKQAKRCGYVSKDTYDILVGVGVGIESRLPNRIYYTDNPSPVNLNATIEASQLSMAALAAVSSVAVMAFAWKIISWIYTKFNLRVSKGSKIVEKKAEMAEEAYDKNKKLEANGNPFVTLDNMIESDITEKLKATHGPNDKIKPDDVRAVAAAISIDKMKVDAKKYIYVMAKRGGNNIKENASRLRYNIDNVYIPITRKLINSVLLSLKGSTIDAKRLSAECDKLMDKHNDEIDYFLDIIKLDVSDEELAKVMVAEEKEIISSIKDFFSSVGRQDLVKSSELKEIKDKVAEATEKLKNFKHKDDAVKKNIEDEIEIIKACCDQLTTITKIWGDVVAALNSATTTCIEMENAVEKHLTDKPKD